VSAELFSTRRNCRVHPADDLLYFVVSLIENSFIYKIGTCAAVPFFLAMLGFFFAGRPTRQSVLTSSLRPPLARRAHSCELW